MTVEKNEKAIVIRLKKGERIWKTPYGFQVGPNQHSVCPVNVPDDAEVRVVYEEE